MADFTIDKQYNEAMAELTTKSQVHASVVNPYFKQLINNDAKLNEQIGILIKMKANPLFYGAKGDGTTNDRLALQNAAYSMPNGGTLEIPTGDFLLQGTDPQLLLVDRPIQINGKGQYSRLRVDPTVPNTTDVIRVSPSTSLGKDLAEISNIQIMPVSGTPARHAIHFDVTNVGQYLARFLLYRIMILPLGGWGVYLTNPTNNDGFFCGEIEKNLIYGGMYFQRLGDSVRILENTLAGNNIGVHMSGIDGACQVMIRDNNITTAGGAIRVDDGDQVKILNNQIEQVSAYTGTVDATVYLGDVSSSEIIGNNITGHGNVAHNIRLAQAYRTTIDKNKMRQGTAEIIRIDAASNKTDIGYNNFYINASETEISPSILDNGIGTMGVKKSLTLQNGYTNASATYNQAGCKKASNGMIHLTGRLNIGTKTAGTTIATLPVGFRPDAVYTLTAGVLDTDSKTAKIIITTSGNIQVETLSTTATRLDLDGLSFSATY